MLQLTLAYVNQAEREREVASDLRRRQILKPPAESMAAVEAAHSMANRRRAAIRARAAGR